MSIGIRIVEISSLEVNRWNDLLFSSINGSYRQTFPFEYAQKLNGRKIQTFIFQKDDVDIAGAHYSIKGAYKNFVTTADVLSGFVFKVKPDQELITFVIEHFISWARKKKAAYLRIYPWLTKSLSEVENRNSTSFSKILSHFGFKIIEPGRHTYWINLDKDEDILYSSLSKKARQNIRRAKLRGMELVKFETPSDEVLESFWKLYLSRSNQKKIPVTEKIYMINQVAELLKSGLSILYFARFEEKMINVSLVSTFGQAASLHSGMNPEVNKDKNIPSPGHFLRWEIIQDLKRLGNKIHDMGFCPGPVPIKNHSNYGIWYFKYSFGGDHVEFLPGYGKVLQPVKGRLFQYWKYKK